MGYYQDDFVVWDFCIYFFSYRAREAIMSNESFEQQTVLQRLLDDINLMMCLCLVFPTVFYVLWGVMEVATIPVGK